MNYKQIEKEFNKIKWDYVELKSHKLTYKVPLKTYNNEIRHFLKTKINQVIDDTIDKVKIEKMVRGEDCDCILYDDEKPEKGFCENCSCFIEDREDVVQELKEYKEKFNK